MSNFGSTARHYAFAVSTTSKGYFGTRHDGNTLDDFWEYSPNLAYDYEKICMVTLDTALNKNKIIWEKTSNVRTDYFNIYRDSTNLDTYDLIGTVSFNDAGVFVDNTSNPSERWYKYKILVVDSAGSESELSLHHKSIYLVLSKGTSGEINLYWNHYEGGVIDKYIISRGDSLSNLDEIDSITSVL